MRTVISKLSSQQPNGSFIDINSFIKNYQRLICMLHIYTPNIPEETASYLYFKVSSDKTDCFYTTYFIDDFC